MSVARRPSAAERAAAFTLDIDSILTGGQPAVAANRPAAIRSSSRPPSSPVNGGYGPTSPARKVPMTPP